MAEERKGRFRHYCYEWDYLEIDETCWEFEFCLCFRNNADARVIQHQMLDEHLSAAKTNCARQSNG